MMERVLKASCKISWTITDPIETAGVWNDHNKIPISNDKWNTIILPKTSGNMK